MTCSEAEIYISAVCDGEAIPREHAAHISECVVCRRTLADYSQMGAELRLLSMRGPVESPHLELPKQRTHLAFLRKRILIPRIAVAALILCAAVALATTSIVRAQSHPLWFEFGYSPYRDVPFGYLIAREGSDDTRASLYTVSRNPIAVALRIKIKGVSNENVTLQVRAVPARIEATADGVRLLGGPIGGVSLKGVPETQYKPGSSLVIPVEGGGTIYLKGDVLDHQPRIAFGTPLEPAEDNMNVRSPVLIESDKLLGQLQGASAIADASSEAVFFAVPNRVFAFALRPFPGAVKAEANWGRISFKLDGAEYSFIAAAPITGGDQPREVWVRSAEHPDWGPHCDQTCLGSGPLPK